MNFGQFNMPLLFLIFCRQDRNHPCISFKAVSKRISLSIYEKFQQIVAFIGVLVYKFYGDELREMFGYEEHPYGFYTMAGKLTTNCY